jgi:hypothetical protein
LTTAEVSAPASLSIRRSGTSWFQRWSPLAGLLFVVGAFAVAFTPAADETGETAAEVVSFAAGKNTWFVVAMLFALAALPLIGSFVAGIYVRLQRAGAATEAVLTLVGGVSFALLFFVAVVIWTAPLADMPDSSAAKLAQASTYLAIDDIGWLALGGAGVAAGLMAIAASLGARRTGAVPSWAAWIGVALGVLSFGTFAFLGIFAWLAWIAVASLGLLMRGGAAETAAI